MERCAECGYDYQQVPREGLPSVIRHLAAEHAARLTLTAADQLRARRSLRVWTPLEYACHLRDVLTVQRERIDLALAVDQPTFTSMRRQERVVEERYNQQEPSDVAEQLQHAAAFLADRAASLNDDEWVRTAIYNFPETRPRTVEWIVRHTIHEQTHHLLDVDRQLAGQPQG